VQAFISISLVYLGVYALSAWSLNLQYGYAGIINFGWIVFQSIGAYVAAVVSLGPTTATSYQTYILGARLPFPLPLLMGTLAGAALALVLGLLILTQRIRSDFQAIILLVVAIIAAQVVSSATGIFNGANGLSGVPKPFNHYLHLSDQGYQWFYVAWMAVICLVVYVGLQWLCRTPWGRALRTVREDDVLAAHAGINVSALRVVVFVVGGAIAGLSGALLVEFLGTWSPDAWSFVETFVVFVAVYVGGRGNNLGALLGAFLVPVVIGVMPSFLPQFGYPGLTANLEWIVIALLWLVVFYVRPLGILPERRHIARRPAVASTPPVAAEDRDAEGVITS
jgi:ABC-type branched-subunit amino acid transport system permease subunit